VKVVSFSINVHLYSLNHKILFLSYLMGVSVAIYKSFNAKKLFTCSRVYLPERD